MGANQSKELKLASKRTTKEIAELLQKAGRKIKDTKALRTAVEKSNEEVVKLLLEAGESVHDTEALRIAVDGGKCEVVKLLLKAGENVYDTHALRKAVGRGRDEIVKLLLKAGENVYDTEALSKAVEYREVESVKLLLKAGENIFDNEALQVASSLGRLNILQILLAAGKGYNDTKALCTAVEEDNAEVVKLLLNAGKNVNDTEVLHKAVERGGIEVVELLLKAGGSVYDSEALKQASKFGQKEIVQILLESGTEYKDSEALKSASRLGQKEMVKILLEAGKEYKDSQALQTAIGLEPGLGHKGIVQILVRAGKDYYDSGALKMASSSGNNEIVQILLRAGKKYQDSISLGSASYYCKKEIVQILLGAVKEYTDSGALHLACAIGHKEIVQILLTAGREYEDDWRLRNAASLGQVETVKYLINEGKDKQSYLPNLSVFDKESVERFKIRVEKNPEETKNMKIITLGQRGSGKTCLVKQLLGEDIDFRNRNSANLTEFHRRRVILDMVTKEILSVRSADELMEKRLKFLTESPKSTESPETAKPKIEQERVIYEKAPDHLKNLTSLVQTETSDQTFASKAHVTIYDLGGEEIFENFYPALLTSDSIFLLVFDVNMSTTKEEEEQDPGGIVSCLQSIATYATSESESLKGSPPILLIGSHMDQLSGTDDNKQAKVKNIFKKVEDVQGMKRIFNNHVKGKFTIANLHDSNIDRLDFNSIWKAIVDQAHLQSQWKKLIPGNWLLLEHELLQKKNKGERVLTMNEVHDIDKKLILPLGDNEDIKLFLRYLHGSGFIHCFDLDSDNPIILLDVQWIIDAFKCIITESKFVVGLEDQEKQQWEQYRKSGRLPSKTLRLLLSKHPSKTFMDHFDVLMASMERLGLVVKPLPKDSKDEVDFYIVPYMLRTSGPEKIRGLLMDPSTIKSSTLCVIFNHRFIPRSIWDKFIAACIYRFQPFRFPGQEDFEHFQRGWASFAIDCLWNMIVHCKNNVMKLTMFRIDHRDADQRMRGNTIRLLLDDVLNRILTMNQQGYLKFQYYLHCDYRIHRKDVVVHVDDVMKSSPCVVCSDSDEGLREVHITRNDYIDWFDDHAENARDNTFDDSFARIPTDREIGRFAKYVYSAFHIFFIELGLKDREIHQARNTSSYLPFRTQILKLFFAWRYTRNDGSIAEILSAMCCVGLDCHSIIAELENMQNHPPLDGISLTKEYLQQQPREQEIEIISDYINLLYYNLFIELGLKASDIDQSIMNQSDSKGSCMELLNVWTTKNSGTATFERLLLAMRECNMDVYGLAGDLAQFDLFKSKT